MDDEYTTHSEKSHTVADPGDEVLVRNTATEFGAAAGFDETGQEELGLVGTELATNVLKHAQEGEITVAHIEDDDRNGVAITSTDAGPGIDDIEAAFVDGTSAAGSLGQGLGTVNRLADEVTVATPEERSRGTEIIARRWVPDTTEATVEPSLDFGFASRPMNTGQPNGDSFVLRRWGDRALAGVIDGLGHGEKAATASTAARRYIERHHEQSLEAIFQGTERACSGTRGVVMALVQFDFAAESMTFGSVGNIAYKLQGPDSPGLVTRRGVLGSNSPGPMVTTIDWDPSYRLVLHSDGIGTHWNWDDIDDVADRRAPDIAQTILKRFGKDDDATVLVVRDRVQ